MIAEITIRIKCESREEAKLRIKEFEEFYKNQPLEYNTEFLIEEID